MAYRIVIANKKLWLKDVSKIEQKHLGKIFDKIESLEDEPWPKGVQVKKLQHYDLADFRLRAGNYRVLFDRDLENGEVILYRILHRSKLY